MSLNSSQTRSNVDDDETNDNVDDGNVVEVNEETDNEDDDVEDDDDVFDDNTSHSDTSESDDGDDDDSDEQSTDSTDDSDCDNNAPKGSDEDNANESDEKCSDSSDDSDNNTSRGSNEDSDNESDEKPSDSSDDGDCHSDNGVSNDEDICDDTLPPMCTSDSDDKMDPIEDVNSSDDESNSADYDIGCDVQCGECGPCVVKDVVVCLVDSGACNDDSNSGDVNSDDRDGNAKRIEDDININADRPVNTKVTEEQKENQRLVQACSGNPKSGLSLRKATRPNRASEPMLIHLYAEDIFYSAHYNDIEVFETETMGVGVRTTGFMHGDRLVCIYQGERLSASEGEEREEEYCKAGNRHDYIFYYGDKCVDATKAYGTLGRLMNHSRLKPNCVAVVRVDEYDTEKRKHIFIKTIGDIEAGVELKWDYGDFRKDVINQPHLHWMANS